MPERVSNSKGSFLLSSERGTPPRRTTNVSCLFRSHSVHSFPPELDDSRRGSSKLSVPFSARDLTTDKTPITHFCTPRRRSSASNTSLQINGHNRSFNKTARRLITSPVNTSPCSSTPLKFTMNETFTTPTPITPSFMATPDCFSRVKMDTTTPRRRPLNDVTLVGEESSNLTVGIRVRPLNPKEKKDPSISNAVAVGINEVSVSCDIGAGITHQFSYDHCFSSELHSSSYASQEDVFKKMVYPLVEKAFEGYNACLFAYGQTGSGKSYSMLGSDNNSGNGRLTADAGIIPRFCYELFDRLASQDRTEAAKPTGDSALGNAMPRATVEISYLEIYNEKIHDLLVTQDSNGKRPPLKVREHPQYGPYVVDLSTHGVESFQDVQAWLRVGNSQRATAATGMNEKSSRSHSIFSVILTQTQPHGDVGLSRRSNIHLVDLAGSERLSQTCASGERLREGVSINRSLLTLGKVITALSEGINNRKRTFVPYRESVLTWLLKESLGGNSSTMMLATISPCSSHLEETLATLRYAHQARAIVNRVHVNEDPSHRRIRQLLAEIATLRETQEQMERQHRLLVDQYVGDVPDGMDQGRLSILEEKLQHSERQVKDAENYWPERLREAERCKNQEILSLRQRGVALSLDTQQPCACLVNLAPDPSLSGALLYLLPPGAVRVGRLDSNSPRKNVPKSPSKSPANAKSPAIEPLSPPQIQLDGPLVHRHHCTIENRNGRLELEPGREGLIYINGNSVTTRTVLRHGDRLVLGGNHYFRVSNPHDKTDVDTPVADYEFAHKEILAVQEAKLKRELDYAKQKAMRELDQARQEVETKLQSQRLDYEIQLQQLGETLEQQRDAFYRERREKELLEAQNNVLEAEIKRKQLNTTTDEENIIAPESNRTRNKFLEDLEALFNGSMNALDTTCASDGSQSQHSPGSLTSMHEINIQTREASERCKELGIPYDFQQQHVIRDSRLETVIRVRDHSQKMAALWSPARFFDWLVRLRDWDPDRDDLAELLADDSDDKDGLWETDEVTTDEPDGSICVNTHPIRRRLSESLSLMDSQSNSPMNCISSAHLEMKVEKCMKDIEKNTRRLFNLLNSCGGCRNSLEHINDIESDLAKLKNSVKKEAFSLPVEDGPCTPGPAKSVRFFIDS